jgi:para-aminobenzoate synthetase component 1
MDTFQVPALAVGLYDVVLAFDHATGRAWIVSQGFPEVDPSRRRRRAKDRIARFHDWIAAPPGGAGSQATRRDAEAVSRSDLSVQHRLAGGVKPAVQRIAGARGATSNFSGKTYLETVRRAIDYIRAGDVFQVNLAQRLICPARGDAASLYGRLRRSNPAPFAGYFDAGDFQIASASPERFLRVHDDEVEARPIKGTRPRTGERRADAAAQAELIESEKDRAENVMIVDLLRNDLSRVCTAESVSVGQLCGLEAYRHVFHLVSSVVGRLRPECSPIELLRAAFPGGSVTGAPKVRAMEIIAELEPDARGAYCGSLGYLGFDGSADLNILIRTITAGRGWWQFPVGGGIVAQSTPSLEYEETWHKAEGLIRAL